MGHTWRFFRSGGFDQVIIDSVADLENLAQLDKKLWAALACPTKGLELDARTLAYIDADNNQRIRVPELLNAIDWALAHLSHKEVLFSEQGLALSAINQQHADAANMLAAAQQLLQRLGKPQATHITPEDTQDLSKMFPANLPNGDGLVPAALAIDPLLAAVITDIIETYGGELDRSGEQAVSADKIKQFFADLHTLDNWENQFNQQAELRPFAQQTEEAYQALLAVEAKIDDYFTRVQLANFDEKSLAALNGSEAQFAALGQQLLAASSIEAQQLPLAKVSQHLALNLQQGINPAWQAALTHFSQVVLEGQITTLNLIEWTQIKVKFEAYKTWLAQKPVLLVDKLTQARRQFLVTIAVENQLLALVDEDLNVKAAADALVDLDKLVRYQAYLLRLVHNFISFSDFYQQAQLAVFQAGTLFIDNRSCDLVVQVNDMTKHSSMAGLSHTYLVYCDCTRKADSEKMTIVAAVTAGEAGNLMVGRNGVFYDVHGQDWDATVIKIIENAISVQEAFWMPYRRLGRMVSNQLQKMAAEQDKAIEANTSANITSSVTTAQEAAKADKPVAAQTPFDVAKFAGVFAAIGLAVGAIATALASVVSGFMGLVYWQMPIAICGLLLVISGPSMLMAWFKLRQRNLSPILDANGWAVNTRAKVNIRFGQTLTKLAALPKGAKRSLSDPFA